MWFTDSPATVHQLTWFDDSTGNPLSIHLLLILYCVFHILLLLPHLVLSFVSSRQFSALLRSSSEVCIWLWIIGWWHDHFSLSLSLSICLCDKRTAAVSISTTDIFSFIYRMALLSVVCVCVACSNFVATLLTILIISNDVGVDGQQQQISRHATTLPPLSFEHGQRRNVATIS